MPAIEPPREPSAMQIQQSLAAWHAVREALLVNDPDLTTDEAVIFDRFAPEKAHPEDLLRRLIDACAWAELRANEANELRKVMAARRDRFNTRAERMRLTITQLMEILETRDITATLKRALIQRGRVGVRITNADLIPDALCKIERTPMREAIHDKIDAGEIVPGAELSNPGLTLVLRPV